MSHYDSGSIEPGDQVKVVFLGEMQTIYATFVKISRLGYRCVQMENGQIIALEKNDLMHKVEA